MAPDNYEYYQGQDYLMGTLVRLYAFHPPEKREWMKSLADRFFDSLEEDDRRLSIYNPESQVNRINRAAGGEAVVVDPDTFELLTESRRYWEATCGLFDITSGALMRFFGYYESLNMPGTVAKESEELKDLTGCDKLELDPRSSTVRLARPGMLIDLGGIAKGWCVEKRAQILLSGGIADLAVSAGTSTVLACGAPPGNEGWPMELEAPGGLAQKGEEVTLTNCAISVSGNYRNAIRTSGGLTRRHIMDPLTLKPVEEVRQVVVAGPDAAECEAFSTAFLIQGALEGRFNLGDRPEITVRIQEFS